MAELHHAAPNRETVFDVDAERLARVYAQAALDAFPNAAEQESLLYELESVVDEVLKPEPRLEQMFASELISDDDKIGMLDRLFAGKLTEGALNVLKVMARHKRLNLIRNVAKAARELWQKRSGRTPVDLETANPVDPALEGEILTAFAYALGSDPVVQTRVNPDLIGGFVIRIGDRVYDASVRTRLEQMRQAMIDRAVDAIETGPKQFFIAEA
jgi:F-type H+-transporting ATPase subunit delta